MQCKRLRASLSKARLSRGHRVPCCCIELECDIALILVLIGNSMFTPETMCHSASSGWEAEQAQVTLSLHVQFPQVLTGLNRLVRGVVVKSPRYGG